jgi:hypothetical protein
VGFETLDDETPPASTMRRAMCDMSVVDVLGVAARAQSRSGWTLVAFVADEDRARY